MIYLIQKLIFWDIENVTYQDNAINAQEAFPLSIAQALSNINSVLKNDYFTLKKSNTDLSENSKNYINYISFMAIENTYDNVLPNQFDKLKKIPEQLKDYNSKSNKILMVTIWSDLRSFDGHKNGPAGDRRARSLSVRRSTFDATA